MLHTHALGGLNTRLIHPLVHHLSSQGVNVFVKGLIQMYEAALSGAVSPVLQGRKGDEVFFVHTLRSKVTPAGISNSFTSTA